MTRFLDKVFSSYQLGSLILPNRIIRAAMFEPYCVDGIISEEFIKVNEDHIKGGCGMTTTGWVTVEQSGSVHPNQLDMTINELSDLQDFTKRIHDLGGCVSLNISFVGGLEIFSSPEEWFVFDFNQEDLDDLKLKFVNSAVLAKEAGFDGVELHHFIISQFQLEQYNKRSDHYGGSMENRARYPAEILEEMRTAVGEEYPIFAKFGIDKMTSDEELIFHAKSLSRSASSIVVCQVCDVEDATQLYSLENAIEIQNNIDVPVVYNGGVGCVEHLELLMEHFEMVQIGRTLLRDYDFPNKVKNGEETEWCEKCNQCKVIMNQNWILRCVFDEPILCNNFCQEK